MQNDMRSMNLTFFKNNKLQVLYIQNKFKKNYL